MRHRGGVTPEMAKEMAKEMTKLCSELKRGLKADLRVIKDTIEKDRKESWKDLRKIRTSMDFLKKSYLKR